MKFDLSVELNCNKFLVEREIEQEIEGQREGGGGGREWRSAAGTLGFAYRINFAVGMED